MVERTSSNWIQTATGRQFYPLNPRVEDVCIEDIAHALANTCRFNGHTISFYSVAQHSVLVSYAIPSDYAMWGLLHDASEAYIADITRPVKPYLANYAEIEERLTEVIAEKFGLTLPMPPEVKHADIVALNTEKRDVMGTPPAQWSRDWEAEPLPTRIEPYPPATAKQQFLYRYRSLVNPGVPQCPRR